MNYNKWTLGLAAAGVVSLASVAQAQTASAVLSAVDQTTISGYVDTSAQWNPGTGNANTPPYSFGEGKADGFNLNVVQVSIAKALDESPWASGYRVDLWMGPDAAMLGTGDGSDFAIRQAYVQFRVPVANGLDLKMGTFDTVVGYESLSSASNPHYTHSYGFTIEPTSHTGLLGTYQFCDMVSASAGIANTIGPRINERAFGSEYSTNGSAIYAGDKAESYKSYMGSVALTAPQSMGFFAGSSLYGGVVNGFSSTEGDNQTSWYLGSTLTTPVTGLKFGFSYDNLDLEDSQDRWAGALYGSLQVTEKLTFLARGEYLHENGNSAQNIFAATATAQYQLWQNVVSRVEFRWDHAEHGDLFGGTTTGNTGNADNMDNAFLFAGQLIYQF